MTAEGSMTALERNLIVSAALLVFLIMSVQIVMFWSFRTHRMIKALGLRETIVVAVSTAGLAAYGILSLTHDIPCELYLASGIIPISVVWHTFMCYVQRFQRLYRKNRDVKVDEEFKGWQASLVKFSLSQQAHTVHGKRNRRILLGLVLIAMATLFEEYLRNDWDADDREDCGIAELINLLSMLGIAVLYSGIFVGLLLDVGKQAKKGDALGIKGMLTKMMVIAISSMLCFVPCLAAGFLGVIDIRYSFVSLIPFIMVFHYLLLSAPVARARKDYKGSLMIMESTGLGRSAKLGTKSSGTNQKAMLESAQNKDLIHLQGFLLSSEGFLAIKNHLQAELGLETLLFILETFAYSQKYSTLKEEVYQLGGGQVTPLASRHSSSLAAVKETDLKKFDSIEDAHKNLFPMKQQLTAATERLQTVTPKVGSQSRLYSEENEEFLQMQEDCIHIYEKFVSPRSEMQVNLPARLLTRFHGIKKRKRGTQRFNSQISPNLSSDGGNDDFKATPEIFDECALEIINMLYYDSFQRFLSKSEANKQLWESYLKESKAFEDLQEGPMDGLVEP